MLTHEQIWQGIDRLAKSHGYSASGLAKKAGLDPTSFNKSKRNSPEGKPRWPSTESISKILTATNATMSELISLIDPAVHSAKSMAKHTAEILINTESVLFNPQVPFTLKSGRPSPVYVDCRRLISFPKERNILMDYAAGLLTQEIGAENIDLCAGGETAGIPYGAFIAERLQKSMVYVRKEPKGYGRMAQIEGVLPDHRAPKAILIEDLQTDGGSKKIFIEALRAADVTVEHAFVVFHYGIFAASKTNMRSLGINLHALCTWWDVLDVAKDKGYFDDETLHSVEQFLNNPMTWAA